MDNSPKSISRCCIAPINIAVIKYWGKSDEDHIIPLNDSISITLDTDYMFTKTTATTGPHFTEDSIILNNQEESGNNVRFKSCLSAVRKLASKSSNMVTVERSKWKVAIVSENNFPTKAGLASSASGYACLVHTLAQLYELDSNAAELSSLARRGSGSACRSLFGGFVRWYHQSTPCIAKPVAGADHWPQLHCLVAVVSNRSKMVGSTEGMRRSVETSDLLKHRVASVVPQRIEAMQRAILDKNFTQFAELTMRDSNQFHAICIDTYPPLFYMNGTSHAIVEFVHRYNQARQQTRVAYTFDAGPNAVLFMEESELDPFATLFHSSFSSELFDKFYKGLPLTPVAVEGSLAGLKADECFRGQVQYVIHCRVGQGPLEVK